MSVWGKFSKFINENIILNWHPLTRCCLVMVLGALVYMLWISWYVFVFSKPTLKYWMNESLYKSHLIISWSILVVFLLLAILSWQLKKNKKVHNIFPYFAILYFGITLIYGGFNVGILSPATIGGYISLISVGIVLLERKVIYSTAIPVTIFMLSCIVLSGLEKIPYAPLFSQELNQTILSENPFWIYIVNTIKNLYNDFMSYPVSFRKKILTKIEKGQSIRAVAQQFEIDKNTIVEWKKRIEIKRTRPRKPSKVDDDALRADVEKYPDDFQYERAARFGCGTSTIGDALKRLKITVKKRPCATRKQKTKPENNIYKI